MPGRSYIYIGNTHTAELTELTNGETGALISDATVQVSLKDAAGVDLVGETWPVTLAPVSGTPGAYRGNLAAGLVLAEHQTVYAEFTVASAGLTAKWTQELFAIKRRPD